MALLWARSELVLALFARTRDVDLKFEVSIFI